MFPVHNIHRTKTVKQSVVLVSEEVGRLPDTIIMPRIFRHSNFKMLGFLDLSHGDKADQSRDAGHGLGEFWEKELFESSD